jgi:chitinase
MPYWGKAPFGHCSDSNEYQLMSVESKDQSFMSTINGMKGSKMKLILSVGGWNFPSAYFSKMVASSESRAKFIKSANSFMSQHNADGIDLDWEYPCSEPRDDPVKISCTLFRSVHDDGGKCPQDTDNLPLLLKEMRAAMPNKVITIASQASEKHAAQMNIAKVTPYIDRWNIMTYDYTVSDVPDTENGAAFSPNCPLYNPDKPAEQMSIKYSVDYYLKQGVPKEKIMVGVPFYGHTWYAPSIGDAWNKWGGKGEIQGDCCGPFKQTYGGKFGKGCNQCGTYMFSETEAAKPQKHFYDDVSKSDIAYFSAKGADGYTDKGFWISYNGVQSMKDIAKYVVDEGLAGVFSFDTSMDSMSGSQCTWKLTNAIVDTLSSYKGNNTN